MIHIGSKERIFYLHCSLFYSHVEIMENDISSLSRAIFLVCTAYNNRIFLGRDYFGRHSDLNEISVPLSNKLPTIHRENGWPSLDELGVIHEGGIIIPRGLFYKIIDI